MSTGAQAENDFEIEQMVRLTLLEALYTKRRIDPSNPSLYSTELETMLRRPREHLEVHDLVRGAAEVRRPRRPVAADDYC